MNNDYSFRRRFYESASVADDLLASAADGRAHCRPRLRLAPSAPRPAPRGAPRALPAACRWWPLVAVDCLATYRLVHATNYFEKIRLVHRY